jgi:ferritin-like metal-binding protein YciE
MASITSLHDHLVEELNDLLNAEEQLIEALPEMTKRATAPQLKQAFRGHLAQTRTHRQRASQALRLLGEKASGKTCEAMEGLLSEGEELMQSGEPGALLDAMLITAAQKVEHYEIATYGTARTYAQVLGERETARLLEQTLREEKAADKKLTGIAERSVNARASREYHEQSGASDMVKKGAEWVSTALGGAVRRVMPAKSGETAADRKRASRRTGRGRRRAASGTRRRG